MSGHDWRDDGNCVRRTIDELVEVDAVMFPERGVGATERADRLAAHAAGKAICAGCPVVAECLADALRTEGSGGSGRYGVRGGLSPDERADVWRRSHRVRTQ